MTQTSYVDRFLETLRLSRLVSSEQLDRLFEHGRPTDLNDLVSELIKAEFITPYQSKQLLAGNHRGFFLGPYRILRSIGKGGMGMVFLASHTSLNRRVALKVMNKANVKKRLEVERFFREARAAAAFDHPNIVKLFDISKDLRTHYLVMEYVSGCDLQTLLTRTGPLPYAQAAQHAAQAAAGLQHAHERGFLHRDIKPANLMLSREGGVKILDMGLARRASDQADHLTARFQINEVVGSIDYISPEQALNSPLDARSDIYSLGATLFTLVTGQTPFEGSPHQKLMQHQFKETASLVEKLEDRAPPVLSQIILKMMAKSPNDRYQSTTEVIEALGPWITTPTSASILPVGSSSSGEMASPTIVDRGGNTSVDWHADPPPAWRPSRSQIIWGSVGLGLLLVNGLIGSVLKSGPDTPSPSKGTARPAPVRPVVEPPKLANLSPSGSDVLASEPRELYALDFSQLKPFTDRGRITVENDRKTWLSVSKTGEGNLPVGWSAAPSQPEIIAEYFAEPIDGKMVLGCRRCAGEGAAMLSLPDMGFPKGRAELRIEYRTSPGASNHLSVRLHQAEPVRSIDLGNLNSTEGDWVQKTVNIDTSDLTQGCLGLHHHTTEPNSEFQIRVLSIVWVGQSDKPESN
jgi:serine/threonine protein kinase